MCALFTNLHYSMLEVHVVGYDSYIGLRNSVYWKDFQPRRRRRWISYRGMTSVTRIAYYTHAWCITFLSGVGLFKGTTNTATIFSNYSTKRCPYSMTVTMNLGCISHTYTYHKCYLLFIILFILFIMCDDIYMSCRITLYIYPHCSS